MTEPEPSVYTPAPQQPATAPPAPVRPKNTAVVVLAIIAGLLFCTTGAFGTLFFIALESTTAVSKEVQDKGREISELRAKAKAGEEEAAKARNERETVRFELARAEKCRAAGKAFTEASFAEDQAKGEAAARDIFAHC